MNESKNIKHAPGPWHRHGLEIHAGPPFHICVANMNDFNTRACVNPKLIPNGYSLEDRVEANANLVVAAPETAAERDKLKDIVAGMAFALGCCSGFLRSKSPKNKANRDKFLAIIQTAIDRAQ